MCRRLRPPGRRCPRAWSGVLFAALVAVPALPGAAGSVLAGGSATTAALSPAPSLGAGTPGAHTLGDPFYPTLGNGGYDTQAIDLAVTWAAPDRGHPAGLATVHTALTLLATQRLSALSLDLAPASTTITAVEVDGEAVAWSTDAAARKLLITLPAAADPFATLTVTVDSTAVPAPVPRTGEDGTFVRPDLTEDEARIREGRGLIADGDGGMLLAAQPNGAHTLFPVNDHPQDLATYEVTLTAPPGMLGVATGALEGMSVAADGAVTTTWSSGREVPSHVLALGVGRRVLRTGPAVDGVTYRSAIPTDVAPIADGLLAELPQLLAWLEDAIGIPYPFDTFGLLAYSGRPTTAILEGQTLVLIPASVFSPLVDACRARGTIVHEAAHQWFGDRASVARWDEKWLSEGHATYYEWRWLAEHGCLPATLPTPDAAASPAPGATPTPPDADALLDARMRTAYEAAAGVRARYGPPSAPADPAAAYTPAIYDQGALALYALRLEVGDRAFRRLERGFLRQGAQGPVSTGTLVRIASSAARRDLEPFLDAWLYGPVVPPMPHRPDWTTDPAATPSPGAADAPPTPTPTPAAPTPRR